MPAQTAPAVLTIESERFDDRIGVALVAALVVLAVLNVADIITTHIDLAMAAQHGRRLVEGNPIASVLPPNGRVEAVKIALLAALGWRVFRRPPSVQLLVATWATVAVYVFTVANNVLAMGRLH